MEPSSSAALRPASYEVDQSHARLLAARLLGVLHDTWEFFRCLACWQNAPRGETGDGLRQAAAVRLAEIVQREVGALSADTCELWLELIPSPPETLRARDALLARRHELRGD